MVTLSVTPSRIAAVLADTADLLEKEGWDPYLSPLINAIDRAAGYAEASLLAALDALAVQLGDEWPGDWERRPERTQAEVLAALRAAAGRWAA